MGLNGLKLKYQQGCDPFLSHFEEAISLSFPASAGHLNSLAYGCFLLLQSKQRSIFKPLSDSSSSHLWLRWVHSNIAGKSLHLNIRWLATLNSIYNLNSPFSYNLKYSQVLGLGHGHFWGWAADSFFLWLDWQDGSHHRRNSRDVKLRLIFI